MSALSVVASLSLAFKISEQAEKVGITCPGTGVCACVCVRVYVLYVYARACVCMYVCVCVPHASPLPNPLCQGREHSFRSLPQHIPDKVTSSFSKMAMLLE